MYCTWTEGIEDNNVWLPMHMDQECFAECAHQYATRLATLSCLRMNELNEKQLLLPYMALYELGETTDYSPLKAHSAKCIAKPSCSSSHDIGRHSGYCW